MQKDIWELLQEVEGFDWDHGNVDKNWIKHNVSVFECAEVFANEPFVSKDVKHSVAENRYYALGMTDKGRLLYVVFTFRGKNIRVISARDANRKERHIYEEEKV